MTQSGIPAALTAPAGAVTVLNEAIIQNAIELSRESPRRRIILPFHQHHDEKLHRMFNVMQPGTYIRPHRHSAPPKAESIVLLRGSLWFVVFTDTGEVSESWRLAPGLGDFGVDIAPGVFHTFIVTEADTVIFEVKPGPYEKADDKDFATWAPAEGEPEAARYQEELLKRLVAGAGD